MKILPPSITWNLKLSCVQGQRKRAYYTPNSMLSRLSAVYEDFDSHCLTVDHLKRATVVGQFDKRVILLLCRAEASNEQRLDGLTLRGEYRNKSYLFGIDQHAAHERILLERFENQHFSYFQSISNVNESESVTSRQVSIKLTGQTLEDIYRKLKDDPSKKHKLLKFGFSAHIKPHDPENAVYVTKLPCIILQNNLQECHDNTIIANCLRAVLLCGKEANHMIARNIVQALRPLLQSRACHTAIRFGQKLTKSQMQELISKLSRCRLAFQCAHGRPTAALIKVIRKQD